MARPPVDPWHSPAAIEMLMARSLPITRTAFLKMLAGTLKEEGTQGRAADALIISLRQLARWIAWIRENDPEGAAMLPDMPAGGYRRADEPVPPPAPRKVRKRR
ncbi:MAG: hypothetical protein EPO40_08430 [Myxococcaceae bacterium]|nr:MAG: hypothetical protein EPO40_08430 [Myxococcaceae bacterium]